MKLKLRDLAATLLVAAIAVPYVGYLVRGDMPFIEDPTGMTATGLVLGLVAYLVISRGDPLDRVGKIEAVAAAATLALGVVALAFAETGAAEALLAAFMVAIGVVFVMKLVDHVDVLHLHSGLAR